MKIGLAVARDKKMRQLNKEYRGADRSADVLSFPLNEKLPDGTFYLGDIVVSVDQAENKRDILNKVVHAAADLLREYEAYRRTR